MKHKLSCDIVLDLLPSYIDGLTREITNKEVKEHLEECETCLKTYITMQTPAKKMTAEEQKEIDFLKVTKQKHQRKLIVTIVITVLIGLTLIVSNHYFGNIISHLLVTRAAENYIEETYADKDYYVDDVKFVSGVRYPYYAVIKSESSVDTRFFVFLSSNGEVSSDNYQYTIEERYVVFERINKEYATWVANALQKEDFPVEPAVIQGEELCFGRLSTMGKVSNKYGFEYGVEMEKLELDKKYDIYELGRTAGNIVVTVYSEEVTAEKAAETLLLIKQFLDSEHVSFYTMDLMLMKPMKEGSENVSISVTDFRYEDIYEEGLAERVQAAHDAEQAYWGNQ